jgi:hypothetical protein
VDVTDDDAVRWLQACIWPGQAWRRDLLDRGVAIARRDPPTLVTGDAVTDLADAAVGAPRDHALCVVHTAVLGYLPDRDGFCDAVAALGRDRPVWWVSGEADGLVPELAGRADRSRPGISFVYGVVPLGAPGEPRAVAQAGSHGAWLRWI